MAYIVPAAWPRTFAKVERWRRFEENFVKVWDKAKWHVEGDFPKHLTEEDARRHILFMLHWLQEKGLTTEEGDMEAAGDMGYDTALNEEMVTTEGRKFLDQFYDRWLKSGDAEYGKRKYTPKVLDGYWVEFSPRGEKQKTDDPKSLTAKLVQRLRDREKKGCVEVEHLLGAAMKGDASLVPGLLELKDEFGWGKQKKGQVPLGAWVDVICIYLERGVRAVVEAVQAGEVEPLMAMGLLDDTKSDEAVRGSLAIWPVVERSGDRMLCRQFIGHLGNLLSPKKGWELPQDDSRTVREFLHRYISRTDDAADLGIAYGALGAVGNEESIRLVQSRKALELPWKGMEKRTIKEIRRRLEGK